MRNILFAKKIAMLLNPSLQNDTNANHVRFAQPRLSDQDPQAIKNFEGFSDT